MKTAIELFEQLNNQDETTEVEAKPGTRITRTVLETVCAFANEPGLGGGYILLGAVEDEQSLFPQYVTQHIENPDKLQSDLASQCNQMFNIPVRPQIRTEVVNNDTLIVVKVDEVAANQKPVYFKSDGLPAGAYRRVGPTDHRCTYDDLQVFFADYDSFDKTLIKDTSLDDIDESAVSRYRELRGRVNASAEELSYGDEDLLLALGCLSNTQPRQLTMAGLLIFGKTMSQRRIIPMVRADYIRVPGNVWVEDPDNRFTTIDMRGPLILLAFRLVDAVNADLPKGFLLPDGEIQADATGLPAKALREAIINAIMHRSYREHSPIQIIRYDNRLEITNPGFSLKSEDTLGEPGSQTRNPLVAAVFHDTNLAETKGSGIRAMRRLLKQAHLAPPTFESSRERNQFTSRLLLHHFLSSEDLVWLTRFDEFDLNDAQKQALIFLREVGALDNTSYRQFADVDVYRANVDIRKLRELGLIEQKGKGRGTYYLPSPVITTEAEPQILEANRQTSEGTPQTSEGSPQTSEAFDQTSEGTPQTSEAIFEELPQVLRIRIADLSAKERDKSKIQKLIVEICKIKAYKLSELAHILGRNSDYLSSTYIKPLIENGELTYRYPEMIKHPDQAYKATKK